MYVCIYSNTSLSNRGVGVPIWESLYIVFNIERPCKLLTRLISIEIQRLLDNMLYRFL